MIASISVRLGYSLNANAGHQLRALCHAPVQLSGLIGNSMVGRAFNSVGSWTSQTVINDITMAKEAGIIIADSSGLPGFVADRRKQRDGYAIPVKDTEGSIGGSDEN